MKNRWFVFLSLILVAGMLLTACGPKTTATPTAAPTEQPTEKPTQQPTEQPTAEPEKVEITIWHQWDGKYLEAITQAFKDYEAAHPNVKINLDKPEDVAPALNVAIPAGEGPDIIGWANDKIGEQALVGNIVALDDYGITKGFLQSTYEPAAVAGVMWKGKIWALPETQEGIALVYNADLVTAEYLPTDPLDFNALLAKAEKFQQDTGKVLICNQGFGGADPYHLAPIYFGHGVPSYVDDEGKGYLNTPEMIAGGEFLLKLKQFSLNENSYEICMAALKEGKVGMWWTGPWAIAGVEESGINYDIAAMGRPFVGIKTLMMTKNAVDRGKTEVVLDVMKYFTSAEVQKKLALVNKTIPAASAALKDPEVAQLKTVVGFGKSLNLGVPMSPSPYSSAQWGPVGDASVAIWTGAQTPAEAMAAAEQALEAAIAAMK